MSFFEDAQAEQLVVYLNGEFMPLTAASISPLDRGFVFADGVYEVIPAYGGRLLRLQDHLERLDNSLAGIRLGNPLQHEAWAAMLLELLQRNGAGDQSVYLQVTRGPAFPREHAFPAQPRPTVFAMCTPIRDSEPALREDGVSVITHADIRWDRCDLKTVSLLPAVLMKQLAKDRDAFETLLIREGLVLEGASSNVFMVRHGVLSTPPKGPFLLPGITRDLVLELAAENGFPAQERDIPLAQLLAAEEVWITSSTRAIVPVTRVDAQLVASGRPGPVFAQFYDWYQARLATLRAGTMQ